MASRGSPPQSLASRRHEVRIIGGLWKRTRLPVLDRPGLRPTPDRVRETLFNWLASRAGGSGGELPGWRCLDAFAGSGALGFEAASRGAAEVLLCETDGVLVAQLRALQTRLAADAVRIERDDGVAALQRAAPASLHAVFLDPPFADDAARGPAALVAAALAIRPDGLVYLEAPRRWSADELAPFGLAEARHLRAGAVHAHLLVRQAGAARP